MKFLATLIFTFSSLAAFSQSYYWVGGSGNWSDYANHWATSSGGSTFHTQSPTSANNVFFDANSFSGSGQAVTLDAEANCLSMNWTGVTSFPSIVGNGNTLNIFGSLTLSPDMTANFKYVEFESTTSGNTITTNGTSLGSISITRFNGIGGEWSFQDNFNTYNLYMLAGTLNTNNNNINSGAYFQTDGAATKVLNLGSSEITSERWWMNGTNLTINAGTSKIIVSSFYSDMTGAGPYTYHDIEFFNYADLRYPSAFNEITVPAGLEVELRSGDTFTLSSLVADGTKHEPIIFKTTSEGSEATLSKASGSVTVSWVELKDIHTSGSATFTANDAVDNGNNTGWTINDVTGSDYFWVGNGGDWTDYSNHWATTSGGSSMHSDYPGPLDDVFFDANSFTTAGQTVLNDLNTAHFHDMDWTGVTNLPTFSAPYSYPIYAHGSVTFDDGMNKNVYSINFIGEETGLTFTAASTGYNSYVTFNGTGSYTLMDDISTGSFNHYKGTVNYGDVVIDCSIDYSIGNGGAAVELNLGSSSISCRDLSVNSSSSPVVNFGTSTITVERDFYGYGIELNEVVFNGNSTIKGSNSFEVLTIEAGSSIALQQGTTQTINQAFNLSGTKASPINFSSDLSGSQATVSMSSGTVDATYLVLKDIAATGGATFNAAETIDNGNNTGWNISELTGSEYYWVGDGGNWSDFANHWATTSGGSTFQTTVPGVLDDVIFDENSFTTGGQAVTLDQNANFHDMTWTGVTNSPSFIGTTKTVNIYGSLTLDDGMIVNVKNYYFLSDEAETITASATAPGNNSYMYFTGAGSWELQSALFTRELHHHSGTIDFNSKDIWIDFALYFFGSENKTMLLGTSDFTTRTLAVGSATNLSFDGADAELKVSSQLDFYDNLTNDISLGNVSFEFLTFSDESSVYGNLTLATLSIEAGKKLKIQTGATLTVDDLVAVGTADDPIVLISVNSGLTSTISKSSGTVDAYFLELQDITATGGATFNAYNSVNNGNVIGWTFHKEQQTIDFPEIADKAFGDPAFELTASATSSLAVAFEVVSGPATVDGTTLTITGAGTVQVKATQAGNIDYDPAPSVTRTFSVSKASQGLIFDTPASKVYGDGAFDLTFTAGATGNTVVFESSDGTVATISGSTVTVVGAGTTTITASQDGDDDYATAVIQRTFTVNKAEQSITFNELLEKTIGDDPFELDATGGASANPVTFSSSDGLVATVSGSTVTIVGVGTTTITASQEGDNNYEAAEPVERVLTVAAIAKLPQAITFGEIETKTFGDADFDLTATGGDSGLPLTYASGDETVATVSGATVTIVGAGSTTITASQAGDDTYQAATSVEQTLIVVKAAQAISFEEIPSKTFGAAAFELPATGGASGMAVLFTSSDDEVATISGTTVTITGAGTATITASQAGNDNYMAAESVERTLVVSKADQTITFSSIDDFDLDNGVTPIFLEATASSGLGVSFAVDGPATLDGVELTPTDIGTITITASQAGNDNYNAAPVVVVEFSVTSSSFATGVKISKGNLKFYPNPANELLTVEWNEPMGGQLEIRNLAGSLILQQDIISDDNAIDLASTPSGTYLLIVRTPGGVKTISRLIVE
ncbi:T9SS type A sorting domain-containing protein [Imperialibacter roseus]|uniref:T9SS type A sorting domain-containing protein n=1 Tax=Imperialibacter roseus TaxID=1324217 RepID=A0ABZ0IR95_9BACT|nr:T9SS type A sorting domain-containing protein [Imperialibacter roseus]WOK06924.1 T9SS type A sorting domain-containing protein [Imperialibacter roseus]